MSTETLFRTERDARIADDLVEALTEEQVWHRGGPYPVDSRDDGHLKPPF